VPVPRDLLFQAEFYIHLWPEDIILLKLKLTSLNCGATSSSESFPAIGSTSIISRIGFQIFQARTGVILRPRPFSFFKFDTGNMTSVQGRRTFVVNISKISALSEFKQTYIFEPV
jgi:hypothetical protein